MVKTLLELEGLKTRLNSLEIVRGIDLTLAQGEILGIVGESGCGKTMAMRSVMQLLPAGAKVSAEKMLFDGSSLLALSKKELRSIRGKDISMIFQDPMTSLNPLCTIGRHITEILHRHEKMTKHEAEEKAVELLAQSGISSPQERLHQYPHELSGGMRQRVLIAMAFACRPKLLIADEPTTALDVTIQAQILSLIRSLQQKDGLSVMLITHDMGVIAALCHRAAVMYAGLIMEIGNINDIFYAPRHPYTHALLRSVPAINEKKHTRLLTIEGQPPSMKKIPAGCPFAPRCAHAMTDCKESLPPMKKIEKGHEYRCLIKI